MKYVVKVGDQTVEVDLNGERTTVDGADVDAAIVDVDGTPLYRLSIDGQIRSFTADRAGKQGQWRIDLGNGPVEVEALDERTRAIRELAGADDAEADKTIVAPMPGLVVRINVEVGSAVSAGDGLIVVEAMKMENELRAPADGVVSRIEVAERQPVEKGAVLVVLE